jgi:flavorubredoxin
LHISTDEIQEDIFKITLRPPGSVVSFNHFLIKDEMPTLIHTGHKKTFDILFAQIARILDPKSIKYITFSHFEPDECGSLNEWLTAAPLSEVRITKNCNSSVQDSAIRPALIVKDNATLNLGKHQLTILETPHFPHAWEACLFYESNKKVLFSSDIGTQVGSRKSSDSMDLAEEILDLQLKLGYTSFGKAMDDGLKKITKLEISTLATMHGAPLNKKATQRLFALLDAKNREVCQEFLAK